MVGASRGTPEGFRAGQPGSSQQPPPPPPNLAEVMARQTELCKLKWATSSSNLEAEVNPCRPVTRISSVLNRHYSIRPMSLWTQTPGCELLSLSSPYYQPHVQMGIRCSLRPSNSEALLVFGGTSFMLCNLLITLSPGTSFELHSEHTIYQQDSLSGSSMNF
jgi:hypothetical protein